MSSRIPNNIAVALFISLILVPWPVRAEETRTQSTLKGEAVIVPVIVPEREALALLEVQVVQWETPIGKGGLVLAFYNNPKSRGVRNYVETYDLTGNLLEIAWFDEGGQLKVAQDKSLSDPDAKESAKALVMGAEPRFVVQQHALEHF